MILSIITFFYAIPCCDKSSPTSPEPVKYPVINSFTADDSTIARTKWTYLRWTTSNATSCSIDQGIGSVPSSGSEMVEPTETTTYTLTAQNENGSTTASCTIEVKSANLVIDGKIEKDYWLCYPVFKGWVKNTGDNTAWNSDITIYCYGDQGQTTLIDTAWDYLADGNDIDPGVRVPFEAICWELYSHKQIKSRKIVLDWLEKEITQLTKEDFKKIEYKRKLWIELQKKKSDAMRKKR